MKAEKRTLHTIQVKKAELNELAISIAEIQNNAGLMKGEKFERYLPLTTDFDLMQLNKKIISKQKEEVDSFKALCASKGITFGAKSEYIYPETWNDEQKKEFAEFDESYWKEDVEMEVKKFSLNSFQDISFSNCPRKNLFFLYLMEDE